MALIRLLTMGNRSGQLSSLVSVAHIADVALLVFIERGIGINKAQFPSQHLHLIGFSRQELPAWPHMMHLCVLLQNIGCIVRGIESE